MSTTQSSVAGPPSDVFKREAGAFVSHAVEQNGGVAALAERSLSIPSTVAFVAGYVCGMIAYQRYVRAWDPLVRTASVSATGLSPDEVRRVHDLVRLAIDAGSTTS